MCYRESILLGFLSDGYPPHTAGMTKGERDTCHRHAGMTEGGYHAPAGVVPFMHKPALASA